MAVSSWMGASARAPRTGAGQGRKAAVSASP